METGTKSTPRLLEPHELASVVRLLRESRQWSQATLAELSGLSARTIQRVENGKHSDADTRRALGRAFELEDIDAFNKPYIIPTVEEWKAEREIFDREHLTLECKITSSGRDLASVYASSTMDSSTSVVELAPDAASDFAALVDYLRDYRDIAADYSETDKLQVFSDVQEYLDHLDSAGIAVVYAIRNTRIVGREWVDKAPWPVRLVYLYAVPKDAVRSKVVVERKIKFV